MTEEIKTIVKEYILHEFLPGEDPNQLLETTPLITGGVLDSIGTIRLVLFLEERFGIALQARDTDPEYLNTIASVAALVVSKKS